MKIVETLAVLGMIAACLMITLSAVALGWGLAFGLGIICAVVGLAEIYVLFTTPEEWAQHRAVIQMAKDYADAVKGQQ